MAQNIGSILKNEIGVMHSFLDRMERMIENNLPDKLPRPETPPNTPAETPQPAPAVVPVKRGRGRPRLIRPPVQPAQIELPKRKRGRPRLRPIISITSM